MPPLFLLAASHSHSSEDTISPYSQNDLFSSYPNRQAGRSLLKREKLFSVLDRACDKLIQNERQLNITLAGEMVRVPLHEIKYLDVQGNYVTIHAKGDYTVKRTLSEFKALGGVPRLQIVLLKAWRKCRI